MLSRIISISIASTSLAGVAAWFVARYCTFSQHSSISIAVGSALAMTLAVLVVRRNVFYRWTTVAISAGLACRSFVLFAYLNSKGIPGGAYLVPGIASSLCSAALFAFLLTSHQQKQENLE